MTAHDAAAPVGGPLMTRVFKALLVVAGLGLVLVIWRFAVGLGAATGLTDRYPWGIWIAFDVVTGTALACGGYAVALLVYILNRGRYHPLVRPAVLTSALGYSVAAIAIIVDVGRPWLMWRIPISVGKWNLNSALLEVALCVMAYVAVLWIEMSPAFLERWQDSPRQGLRRFAERVTPVVDKALLWIIALGILLPTMHQSSLGTIMLLTGIKLYPLWSTPLLPLLFLISCLAMGYAVVVLESTLSSRVFGRARETRMLASLSAAIVPVIGLYLAIRLIDLVARGRLALMFAPSPLTLLFWLEIALFAAPMVILMSPRRRENPGSLFQAALLIVLAGGLYRFSAYLIAFNPGNTFTYFPTIPEILITAGMVAAEILAYVWFVKRFPILGGRMPVASHA